MARLEFREQPQGQSQTSSQTAVLPANKSMGFIKVWGFSSTGPKSLEAVHPFLLQRVGRMPPSPRSVTHWLMALPESLARG